MKNVFVICSLLFFIALPDKSLAQYEKYKALYIYNFTKRIDWPENQKKGDFIMGVLGKGEIVGHLKEFTQNKKVINQSIVVRQFTNASSIDTCHLLFVTGKYREQIPHIVNNFNNFPLLLITETPGSAGCINFVETEKALLFEIDAARIRNKGLKVSQSLINLGIETNDGT